MFSSRGNNDIRVFVINEGKILFFAGEFEGVALIKMCWEGCVGLFFTERNGNFLRVGW